VNAGAPGALPSRTHLRDLSWGRTPIDATLGTLDVILIDGTRSPMIRREDFLACARGATYGDNRIRPSFRASG
jgi:hypothetical protein